MAAGKILAKTLYTELGVDLTDLRDKAATLGIDLKVWNSSVSEEDAERIRGLYAGSTLSGELGLPNDLIAAAADGLSIDISEPENVTAEAKSRIRTRVGALSLAKQLEIEPGMVEEIATARGIPLDQFPDLPEDASSKIAGGVALAQMGEELGVGYETVDQVCKALSLNSEELTDDDKARIKSCESAVELALELGVDFPTLRKLGSSIGIEIGRVGFKGLAKPEILLLRAQYRTRFGGAVQNVVVKADDVVKPQFAAPTGNKAEVERPAAPAGETPRAAGARGPVRGGAGGRAGGGGGQAAPAQGAGAGGRTGRRRFEVKDSSYGAQRRGRDVGRGGAAPAPVPVAPSGPVTVELPVNLRQLSEALGVKVNDIMASLMKEGLLIRINDSLSQEMIENISVLLSREITVKAPKSAEELITAELESYDDGQGELVLRAPVVTIMGHVDHGKTSLLDAIMRMERAADEAGGITQHIGAFRVSVDNPSGGAPMAVTFIDTPGHEAFTAMRARGAQVTDVAVIVCAADDGVMPQTEEAIAHARAAGVEIVVAINKIDKPDANVARARQMLARHNLMSPDWGGSTEIIEVSAITGKGVPELLKVLAELTEVLELKANPNKPAAGVVLEAHRDEGRGIVATVLVQDGTLRRGQAIVAGQGYGRVRAMYDSWGQDCSEAGPSIPVEVTGLSVLPEAGARFHGVQDYKKAQEIAAKVALQEKELRRARAAKPRTLEAWSQERSQAATTDLLLVLKTDVQGTEETIRSELSKFQHDEVGIRIIHSAVGTISTNDVHLAAASGAIVIGFNSGVQPTAQDLADSHNVEIREYEVIYKLLEDIHAALSGLLKPEEVEVEQGVIEVRKTFRASKLGVIAGCFVTDGVVTRQSRVRLFREGKKIYDGPIESLKRFQDEVKEVREGFECGIVLRRHGDIQEGDVLRPYVIETRERSLDMQQKS